MTARDRTVITVLLSLALLAAGWFLMLAPVREDGKALDAEIVTAQTRLQAAEAARASGRGAEAKYRTDYATVARLGKAIPVDDDVPSLVVQLQSAARSARVDFRSIELASGSAGSVPAAPVTPAAPASGTTGATGATGPVGAPVPTQAVSTQPPGVTVDASGIPSLPLDLTFSGGYFRLGDFLNRLTRLVRVEGERLEVEGRLLTIDGLAIKAGPSGYGAMDASVRANAYLLPPQTPLASSPVGGAPVAAPAQAAAR